MTRKRRKKRINSGLQIKIDAIDRVRVVLVDEEFNSLGKFRLRDLLEKLL